MDVKKLAKMTPREIFLAARNVAKHIIKRRHEATAVPQDPVIDGGAPEVDGPPDPCAAISLAVSNQEVIVDGLRDDLELEEMTLTILVGWLAECEMENMP